MIAQKSFLQRTLPLVMQYASAHRKPRWLPVAKSKVFRIPKRPQIPEEDKKELLRLNNNYRTQMRAIRRFYFEEMMKDKSSLASASSELSQNLEADEWERCVSLNEQWNAQVAIEREQRRKFEVEELERKALEKIDAFDKELQEKIAKASEEIRLQKELSKTFITAETLDAAIDQALDNVVDYNYAIDVKGNKIEGREMAPISKSEESPKLVANA